MSYSYAGDDTTFPATATLLEDGEVWNKTTATEGMIEPLYDRTAYLYRKSVEEVRWASIKSTASGGVGTLSIQDGRGIDSVAYGVPSGSIEVTMSDAFANTYYATSGGAFLVSTPAQVWHVTGYPVSSTVVRLYLEKHDGTTPDFTLQTIEVQVQIAGRMP